MMVHDDRHTIDHTLSRLRRLYHHAIHGGVFNERDAEFIGTTPSMETISLAIRAAEYKQIKIDAEDNRRGL